MASGRSTATSHCNTTKYKPAKRKLRLNEGAGTDNISRTPLRELDQNAAKKPQREERLLDKQEKTPSKVRKSFSESFVAPFLSSVQKNNVRTTPSQSYSSPVRARGSTPATDSPHHHDYTPASPPALKFDEKPQASASLICPKPIRKQQPEGVPIKESKMKCPSPLFPTKNSSFRDPCSNATDAGREIIDLHEYQPEDDETEQNDEITEYSQPLVPMHLVSMLLIGPPRAGKSSLMQNLIGIGGTTEEPLPPRSEPHPPHSEPHLASSDETVLIKKIDSKLVVVNGKGEWRVVDDEAGSLSSHLNNISLSTGVNRLQHSPQTCAGQVFDQKPNSHDETILLNIIDTGSQPEFQEVLINGPAFHLVVFNASESLKEQYQSPDGNSCPTITATKDVLLQSLSTIASSKRNMTSAGRDSETPSPTVVVGTHRRSSKDGRLSTLEVDQLVPKQLERDCPIMAAEEDRLVFEVDNEKDGADRFDQLRGLIGDSIRRQLKPFDVTHLWLDLYDALRKNKKHILQLSECKQLARSLGIPNVLPALEVFHDVGFIMHFSSIDELKDIVIKDFQVVLDDIRAFKSTFVFENRAFSRPLLDDFQKMGRFSLEDVERAGVGTSAKSNFESSQCLTASQLISLLRHRHIVAEILTEKTVQYFIPCALPSIELELPSHEHLDSSPSPLLVQLSCGYHSAAFSCNLVAQLISKWSLLSDCVHYRNKFNFRAGTNGDMVILMCWPMYYEVQFNAQQVREGTIKAACEQVCQELEGIIWNVSKELSYRAKHTLGFYCSCDKGGAIHPVFFGEDRRGHMIMCKGNNRELTEAELMWLQVNQPPTSFSFKELELKDFLNDVAAEVPALWRDVGIQLGLSTDVLEGIKQEAAGVASNAYEKVLAKCPVPSRTWGSIIKALRAPAVGRSDLADCLEKKYLIHC